MFAPGKTNPVLIRDLLTILYDIEALGTITDTLTSNVENQKLGNLQLIQNDTTIERNYSVVYVGVLKLYANYFNNGIVRII